MKSTYKIVINTGKITRVKVIKARDRSDARRQLEYSGLYHSAIKDIKLMKG